MQYATVLLANQVSRLNLYDPFKFLRQAVIVESLQVLPVSYFNTPNSFMLTLDVEAAPSCEGPASSKTLYVVNTRGESRSCHITSSFSLRRGSGVVFDP
jgi:hypothetical protein